MSQRESSLEQNIATPDTEALNRNQPLRAARIRFACLRCQKRKIKCDGKTPVCTSCKRAGAACMSGAKQNDRSSKAYVMSLQARVRWLEDMLRDLCPEVDLAGGPGVLQETQFSDGDRHGDMDDGDARNTTHVSVPEVADTAPTERLAHEIGLVSVTAGQDLRYVGPSSGYSFAKLLFASIGRRNMNLRQSVSFQMPVTLLGEAFQIGPASLPSSFENAVQLSQAYWDNVHCQYPFLHQPSHRKLTRHVFATENPRPIAAFQVLMVLAISTTILSRRLKLPLSAEGYCATAMRSFDKIKIEGSLEGLQCLLLLQVYGMHNPSMGINLWYLNYQCIACVLDLGLQRNVKADRNVSFLTQEMRTRTFWVVYSLDRTLATIMGRPIGLRDEACELRLPLDVDDDSLSLLSPSPRPDSSPPSSTTNAIHIFRLSQLNSEIKYIANSISDKAPAYTYPQIPDVLKWRDDVLDRLQHWAAEIPQLNEIQTKLSNIKYHEVVMLLLRPSPAIPNPSHQSLQICYESSIVAIRTFDELYRGDVLVFTWQTLHSIFLVTITMLYCTWTVPTIAKDTDTETLMADLKSASNILCALAEHFVDARRGRDMLDELSTVTLRWIMDSKSHGRTTQDVFVSQPGLMMDESSDSLNQGASSAHDNSRQSTVREAGIASVSKKPSLLSQPSFDEFVSSHSWEELFCIPDGSVPPIDTIMQGVFHDFQPDFGFGQNLDLEDILAGETGF